MTQVFLSRQKLRDFYDLISRFILIHKKRLLIGFVSLMAYSILMGWLFPWVLHTQIEKQGTEYLGRDLRLESVGFNPFRFYLRIQGAQLEDLPENANEDSLASFELFALNFDPVRSLFTLHWVFDEVKLQGLTLGLIQQSDRTLNISDLFPTGDQQKTEEPTEAASPLKVRIDDLQLISANTSFDNRALLQPHKLVFLDMNFSAEKIELNGEDNAFSFNLDSAGQGQVSLNGNFSLQPLMLMGSLNIDSENIVQIWPQLTELFSFDIKEGLLSLELDFQAFEDIEQQLDVEISNAAMELENLRLNDSQGEFISQKSFQIKGLGLSLGQRKLDIASIEIQNLDLLANLEQGNLDIVQKLSPLNVGGPDQIATSETSALESDDRTDQPWLVQIDEFDLSESRFSLQDKSFAAAPTNWQLSAIDLNIGPLRSDFSVAADIKLALLINTNGQLSVSGQLSPGPDELNIDIGLQAFALNSVEPYLQKFAKLDLHSGDLNLNTSINMDANAPEKLSGYSDFSVAGLRMTDQLLNEDFLRWDKLAVDRVDFDLSGPGVRVNQILLEGGYARVVLDQQGKTNLSDILSPNTSQSEDKSGDIEEAESSTLELQISEISLVEGSAFFADYSLVPQFATGIEQMSGSVRGIAPQSQAQVDIVGKVDRYAPMSLKGGFDLLSENRSLDLELDFLGMQMSSLTPYSGTYAGYFIDSGLLSLGLDYSLDGSELEGTNSFKIQRLEFGEKTDSAKVTDLPLKLAIALLEDVNQEIALDLEVSGDVDSPKFNLGGLIGQAFRRVIGNIVTAPFAALGSLMKGAEDLDRINFEPGSSQLNEKQLSDLDKLSSAMIQRPLLSLKIMGNVEPAIDAQALSKQQLDTHLFQQAGLQQALLSPSAIIDNKALSRAVENSYESQFAADADELFKQLLQSASAGEQTEPESETRRRWYIAMYNQLLDAEKIDEVQLVNLAQARANQVFGVITANQGLDLARVSVQDSANYMGIAGHMVSLELDAE